MKTDLIKPLLKTGFAYVWALVSCTFLGLLITALGLWLALSLSHLEGAAWSGKAMWVLSLVLPFVYAGLGHQRGLSLLLSRLTASHGLLFFDQTLGRFMDGVQTRQPGGLLALLSTPQKLADAFHEFLTETSRFPSWLKRAAQSYMVRLGQRLSQESLLPEGVTHDGQLDRDKFRTWVVDYMQGQFLPSWRNFLCVACVHVATMAFLGWQGR
jgi:hypothetical protein